MIALAPAYTLVVDDLAECRAWLARAATQAFPDTEVMQAATLAEARDRLLQRPPQLALVDLDLPDGSGVALIEALVQRVPRPTVIVATIFADDLHLFPALRAGAAGYVLKDTGIEQLAALLTGALRGDPALSGAIARRVLGWFQTPAPQPPLPLSPREEELLVLLAKGLTIARAAELLAITPSTAASYAKSLYRKLDVRNRAEATLEAARRGLVRP